MGVPPATFAGMHGCNCTGNSLRFVRGLDSIYNIQQKPYLDCCLFGYEVVLFAGILERFQIVAVVVSQDCGDV